MRTPEEKLDGEWRIASYNIHRCYGQDGRYDPARIKQVLLQLNADVIALQEVELQDDAPALLDYFCDDTPWQAIEGINLKRETGHYGNALLTSLPISETRRIDLSVAGREPRGALDITFNVQQNKKLRMIATHLGLRPGERRDQIKQILATLDETEMSSPVADITVLMGDLNEWFLWGRPLRWLQKHFQQAKTAPRARASFPARWPLLALDRIWVKPSASLSDIAVVNNALTRIASDHLPVIAKLTLPEY